MDKKNIAGFNLLELVITIVILTIVLLIVVPSYTNVSAKLRAKSVTSQFYASLLRARSEAIMRNTSVTIVANMNDWGNGWKINDPSDNSKYLENKTAVDRVVISGPTTIVYNSNGRLANNSTFNINITTTGTAGIEYHQCILISSGGRPYVKEGTVC